MFTLEQNGLEIEEDKAGDVTAVPVRPPRETKGEGSEESPGQEEASSWAER